jgi:hypothetical protein
VATVLEPDEQTPIPAGCSDPMSSIAKRPSPGVFMVIT